MGGMSFVHLHTHSEYSLLDGANRVADLIARAKEFEQPALAVTDHGCMFGCWTFQEQAKKTGLKPIIGMEAYVAPGSRFEREKVKGEKGYYHLVLLARDREGYRNLCKLSSIGYTEGFYFKPRLDREVLARHAGGLIVTSACMSGEVARHLLADSWEQAREAAAWYAGTFDDRYYLEVQAHHTPGQGELNERVFKLAGELGLPVVATNDAHFLRADDHQAHDVLLCIGLGKDLSDQNRMRYDGGLYFKHHQEIAGLFPDRPEVLENTLKIADQVDVSFDKTYHVPAFPLPGGVKSEDEMLAGLVWQGAWRRYGEAASDPQPAAGGRDLEELRTALAGSHPQVVERAGYELGVIRELGYAGYFLITADFINWARTQGIPVGPGRGSAAGSIVAYCTGITDLCPLEFDLLFERFLNPGRVSMPDIDVDFCYERRGEVIDYVRQKYGQGAVAQIVTFGTMKSRAVVRDVGRTLGFLPAETDKLAKLIPGGPAHALTVAEAKNKIPEIRELYQGDDRYRRLLDYSEVLEGLSRHASVHAAGVVIAPGPVDDYVPVCTQSAKGGGNGDGESVIVTQYDMNCLEQAGMLKMDFLGLKTLTVIHDAVETIRARHGALRHPESGREHERIEDIPLDDPAVYDLLTRGASGGVFQFESALATDKLRAMRADRFDDLIATNALIRPGPLDMGMDQVYIRRKLGQEEVSYPHPELEEVLEPTYGVIVYQEQVMRVAQLLAGYSLAEADVLRKAVGKKDAALIARELDSFVKRALGRGHDRRQVEEISRQIETFGRYGFNKSHSAAYALLSYQTAWLKCHYPAEFMAALMSAVVGSTDSVVAYIADCRELGRHLDKVGPGGIEVLPPDVNESLWKFTVVGDGVGRVRFGLGAIRGVGGGAVNSILAARREGGAFRSLYDFLSRVDLRLCNKRVAEALIGAGALDGVDAGGDRARLVAGLDGSFAAAQQAAKDRESYQQSLFGSLVDGEDADGALVPDPGLPEVEPWSEGERLAKEKEALGFFISGHPLDNFRELVRLYDSVNSSNLGEYRDQRVALACVVTGASRQLSRRDGSEWGRVTIEDYHGTARVLAFGESWRKSKELLQQDAPVLIRGTVSNRERDEDDPPIFLDQAVPLSALPESGEIGLRLELGSSGVDAEALRQAKGLLGEYPGPAPVTVVWKNGGGNGAAPRLRSRSLRVRPEETLVRGLREVLGDDRVGLERV